MKYEYVTKEYIHSNEFIADEVPFEKSKQFCRLQPSDNLPPTEEELQTKLRQIFSSIFLTKFDNYSQLEIACNISEHIMRKYLKGKRKITIYAVAKLCVGAKLTIEKAEEMFKLQGHIISPNEYRFDAIIIDALKCGDSIDIFYETCKKCGLDEILDKMSSYK